MRITILLGAVAVCLSAAPALAQVGMTSPAPAIGATSPLGTGGMFPSTGPLIPGTLPSDPGGTVGAGATGIPFGATELTPGGLSPAPCLPGTATTGGLSTFDGGGTSGMSSSGMAGMSSLSGTATGCGTAQAPGNAAGTGLVPNGLGTTQNSQLNGGTIPLGSTELNNGGVSPLPPIPGPSTVTSPFGVTSSP
jgi:hypothetical protein